MRYYFKIQLITAVLMFVFVAANAQLKLDTLKWRSPVGIPIKLSGNFAELRSGHFHAGIDIKTNGKEGYKIYSVQDGYISRIKVSPTGYGKAIYIVHPDGYTSVYAHLSRYNIQIEKYVRNEQYKNESFAVNIFPPAGTLKVSKGEVIGLSGNSGSSGGPHLHFEIRNTATSEPLNGLFLGYDIADNIPPKLFQLYVYPQDGFVNPEPSIYKLSKVNGSYTPFSGDTISVGGEFGLGLKVNDYLNGSSNKCGVHFIKVFVDGHLCFHSQFDKFSFSETRYINSLMDYEQNVSIKRKLHKLYVDPNNRLSVYKVKENMGIIVPEKGKVKKVFIETTDVNGNTSSLKFYVRLNESLRSDNTNEGYFVSYNKAFELDSAGLKISIPENALYGNYMLNIDVDSAKKDNYYSNLYRIGEVTVPTHKYYNLEIECEKVRAELESKLILAKLYKGKLVPSGGIFENGVIKHKIRGFGDFVVVADTVPPTVRPIGDWADSSVIGENSKLAFKIDDDFSGIKSYRGEINGNWVLFQYDPKYKYLFYEKDEYFPEEGEVELDLTITDGRGNMSVFTNTFKANSLTEIKNEQ